MASIQQILDKKGSEVWSISPENTVYDALTQLAEKNVGALLVTQGEKLVGLISERDYARKVILQGKASMATQVREIMTVKVTSISPGRSVKEAMAVMTEKRIRHLPVMEEGKIIGVISIGDLVKSIIADQEFVINQLEKYISGEQY